MGLKEGIRRNRTITGRRRLDALLVVAGAAVLVLTAIPIDAHATSEPEADIFRWVNQLPGALYGLVWPVMQLGNVIAVPVVAVAAMLARRFRLAIGLAASGLVVWLLAKVIKDLIERGRPAELLSEVVRRDAPRVGHGYPSGHAAVAVALAAVASPYLNRPLKIVVWILAAAVCIARVYVGAHLPLDVVGGAGFGLAVGSLCNLVLGAPDRVRSRSSAALRDEA
jgi:membrane-associated phospholipid phosphatase